MTATDEAESKDPEASGHCANGVSPSRGPDSPRDPRLGRLRRAWLDERKTNPGHAARDVGGSSDRTLGTARVVEIDISIFIITQNSNSGSPQCDRVTGRGTRQRERLRPGQAGGRCGKPLGTCEPQRLDGTRPLARCGLGRVPRPQPRQSAEGLRGGGGHGRELSTRCGEHTDPEQLHSSGGRHQDHFRLAAFWDRLSRRLVRVRPAPGHPASPRPGGSRPTHE